VARPSVLAETYDALNVDSGQYLRLCGTVLGNVHVDSGARFEHEGFIAEGLYVEAGASVHVRGYAARIEAAEPPDVHLEGYGTMPRGRRIELPFTGPDGAQLLQEPWSECVIGLENVLKAARLGTWAAAQAREFTCQTDYATLDALWTAAAVIALTGMTDRMLWALLGAAVFNGDEDLRLQNLDEWWLWSPADCRKRLPWGQLKGYLEAPPALFTELLSLTSRGGRTRAKEYHDAVWPLAAAALDVGGSPPSPAAVAKVEQFRAMLQQHIEATESAAPPSPTKRSVTPKSKSRPRGAPKPKTAQRSGTRGITRATGVSKRRPQKAITPGKDPVDAALRTLDGLIGLNSVKNEVRDLAGYARVARERARRKWPATTITRHIVMIGNPGTGKTTVAELLGSIYCSYGLLKRPTVRSVLRQDLVGEVIGETEKKVHEVFNEAKGGVLFIDEAYSLSSSDMERDFGNIVINELVPLIDNHRDEIMVVVAGYPAPMKKFLSANEGLAGRFGQTITFPNYTDAELLRILHRFCEKEVSGPFVLTSDAERRCQTVMRGARRRLGSKFDNARMVRRLFEAAIKRQHARVGALSDAELQAAPDVLLQEFAVGDIPSAGELVPDIVAAD
jgi:AAA+ superfamily predicted ATPase